MAQYIYMAWRFGVNGNVVEIVGVTKNKEETKGYPINEAFTLQTLSFLALANGKGEYIPREPSYAGMPKDDVILCGASMKFNTPLEASEFLIKLNKLKLG